MKCKSNFNNVFHLSQFIFGNIIDIKLLSNSLPFFGSCVWNLVCMLHRQHLLCESSRAVHMTWVSTRGQHGASLSAASTFAFPVESISHQQANYLSVLFSTPTFLVKKRLYGYLIEGSVKVTGSLSVLT